MPRDTFPNILFFILGGSGPTITALILVWQSFEKDMHLDFWGRVFDLRRIRLTWWFLTLAAIPLLMALAVVLDLLLGGVLPEMTYVYQLINDPISIPIFLLMMVIGGPLSEELGWRGIVLEGLQQKWSPFRSTIIISIV